MPDHATPGAALRAWRESAGKTQTECAASIGVSQPAWADWEADRRSPHTTHAFAIEDLTQGVVSARVFADCRKKDATSGEAA